MPDQDNELTRLFVRDLDDIPLPERERWRPAPRKESSLVNTGRTFAFGAAAVGVLVLALVASFALRDRPPIAARPTPAATSTATTSATPAGSPTSTGSATPTSSPASAGRYVSAQGYSIETPSPWHLSTCTEHYQLLNREPTTEYFVPVPPRDEEATDTGTPYPTLTVMTAANPENLTPRQWIAQKKEPLGFFSPTGGSLLEDVTYAGRPAVRTTIPNSAGIYHYMVANGGRMYLVMPQMWQPAPESVRASLIAVVESFRFISEAERAAARAALPTPPPPRTAEQVADGLAAAFAAKDVSALSALASPCIFRFGEQAGGTTRSREAYLDELRTLFASGLTVTVQPRPINRENDEFNVWVSSAWRDARGTQTRRVFITRGPNDNWRWTGTVERYGVYQ